MKIHRVERLMHVISVVDHIPKVDMTWKEEWSANSNFCPKRSNGGWDQEGGYRVQTRDARQSEINGGGEKSHMRDLKSRFERIGRSVKYD
ncbi:hypothetical protein TNCV_1527891 [Trichonephila clavipes]|nr:hypothetical protein TNCV_1527891 [Trichonephila clavipes]